MSPCREIDINLASLPTDIIRMIIPGINDPIQIYDSRLISPRWYGLVEEHFNQSIRECFPTIYNFRRSICNSGRHTFRMRILQKHINYFGVANWKRENTILIDAISKEAYVEICLTVNHTAEYHCDKLASMFNRCSLIEHLYLEANSPNEDSKTVEKSLNNVSIGTFTAEGLGFPSRNDVSTLLKVLESNTIGRLVLPTCNITEMSKGIFLCQASKLVEYVVLSLETDVVSTWLLAVYKSSFEQARDKLNQSGQVTATFHTHSWPKTTIFRIIVEKFQKSANRD